jgi:sodium transport system permease protein
LRLPRIRDLLAGSLLACLILPPLSEITLVVLRQFPLLKELLDQRQPLVEELRSLREGGGGFGWEYFLVYGLLAAVCEELAFRGFILSGLRQRFRTWPAILLSSFLFAIYHLNVFQALPALVLGIVLGILAVRSNSLLPGMLLHFLNNGAVIGIALLAQQNVSGEISTLQFVLHPIIAVPCTIGALVLLAGFVRGLPKHAPRQVAGQ